MLPLKLVDLFTSTSTLKTFENSRSSWMAWYSLAKGLPQTIMSGRLIPHLNLYFWAPLVYVPPTCFYNWRLLLLLVIQSYSSEWLGWRRKLAWSQINKVCDEKALNRTPAGPSDTVSSNKPNWCDGSPINSFKENPYYLAWHLIAKYRKSQLYRTSMPKAV